MKRSKLINVLVFGFFLSTAGIASVKTANASGYFPIPGPYTVTELDDVGGLSFLQITPSYPGWTPTSIVVQIESNDNQELDGILVWYNSRTKYLSDWSDTVTIPFTLSTSTVLLENGDLHDLRIRWWYR